MTTTTERTRALLQMQEGLAMMAQARTKRERMDLMRRLLRHYPTRFEIETISASTPLLSQWYAEHWK